MPCGHRASMEQRERERQTTLCPQHKHLSTSPSSSCLYISLVPGHFHFAKVSLSPRRRIYAVGVLHLFCGQNSFYFFTFIFAIFFSLPADRLASAIYKQTHTHTHTHVPPYVQNVYILGPSPFTGPLLWQRSEAHWIRGPQVHLHSMINEVHWQLANFLLVTCLSLMNRLSLSLFHTHTYTDTYTHCCFC